MEDPVLIARPQVPATESRCAFANVGAGCQFETTDGKLMGSHYKECSENHAQLTGREIADLKGRNDVLEVKVSSLAETVEGLSAENVALKADVQQLRQDTIRLTRENTTFRDDVRTVREENASIRQENAGLRVTVNGLLQENVNLKATVDRVSQECAVQTQWKEGMEERLRQLELHFGPGAQPPNAS